jgi:phosphoserine phosphatase
MNFILTFVASDTHLSAGHLASIESFAEKEGILLTGEPEWLAENIAADIPIAESLTIDQMQKLRLLLEKDKIDSFCTSASSRKKKLLLADMDSTIVTSETLDEMAAEAGIKDKVAAITERAMRGELDFPAALKERVGLLKDLADEALKKTLEATQISQGAAVAVGTMRENGATCVLVSGGFTFFTQAIAQKLGFTEHHGNILGVNNGKLTGTVEEPILDKESKLAFLKAYTQQLNIDLAETLAIGDGANDLPMLAAAGIGIGYHPKPLLEENLLNCIRHTDLTSMLYIQGYKQEEFIHN